MDQNELIMNRIKVLVGEKKGSLNEVAEYILGKIKDEFQLQDTTKLKEWLNKNIVKLVKKGKKSVAASASTQLTMRRKPFMHGINVMITSGTNKGIEGVQKEFYPAKYELYQNHIMSIIGNDKNKVGDIISGIFGTGRIVGEEAAYYMLKDQQVKPENIVNIVTFYKENKLRIGKIVSDVSLSQLTQEEQKPVEKGEELRPTEKMIEIINKMNDLRQQKKELEEKRYTELLGKIKVQSSTSKPKKMSIFDKLKTSSSSSSTKASEKYDSEQYIESTELTQLTNQIKELQILLNEETKKQLIEQEKKRNIVDIFQLVDKQPKKVYTIQELKFNAMENIKSEQEFVNLFARNISNVKLGKTYEGIVYENEYVIDKINGNVYKISQVNYVPKKFIVEYKKEGMFDPRNIREIQKDIFEIVKGEDKGSIWNLKMYYPSSVLIDSHQGQFTHTMIKKNGEYKTVRLQPKYLFYFDLVLKNGNNAQVNKIEVDDNNKIQLTISELTKKGLVKHVIHSDEIETYQPGFSMNVTTDKATKSDIMEDEQVYDFSESHNDEDKEEEDEEEEEQYYQEEQEEQEEQQPEYRAGFKDTSRTTQDYTQLSEEEKSTKTHVEKILKICHISVDYTTMINMIQLCASIQLPNETSMMKHARIACVLYKSNLKKYLPSYVDEKDLIKLGKHTQLSEVYEEIPRLYDVNVYDQEIDDEKTREQSKKRKYIEKTFSRVPSSTLPEVNDELVVGMKKMKMTSLNSCFNTFEEYAELLLEKKYFSKSDLTMYKKMTKADKKMKDLDIVLSFMKDVCNKVSKMM